MSTEGTIAERLKGGPAPDWVSDCGTVVLYNADCLDVLRELPRSSVDAVITDPPYCSGGATEAAKGRSTHQGLRSETVRHGRFGWFKSDNMTTAGLCELLRSVCVHAPIHDGGSILAFCDWRMVSSLSPAMESAGYRLRNVVVWDKGHFGCGTGFRPQHELVLHLTMRSPEFFSASIGNVITCGRPTDRDHPTQKPVELLEKLVDVVTPSGGVVADIFLGSGSAGVAATTKRRQFVGVERDPDYFAIAVKRIKAELERFPLFKEPDAKPAPTLFDKESTDAHNQFPMAD